MHVPGCDGPTHWGKKALCLRTGVYVLSIVGAYIVRCEARFVASLDRERITGVTPEERGGEEGNPLRGRARWSEQWVTADRCNRARVRPRALGGRNTAWGLLGS
jgi:hypothetical protein